MVKDSIKSLRVYSPGMKDLPKSPLDLVKSYFVGVAFLPSLTLVGILLPLFPATFLRILIYSSHVYPLSIPKYLPN